MSGRIWSDVESTVTIQGTACSIGEVWDSFVGGQTPEDFQENDPRPLAEQCADYASQVPTMFSEGNWSEDDAATLADALERYIVAYTK